MAFQDSSPEKTCLEANVRLEDSLLQSIEDIELGAGDPFDSSDVRSIGDPPQPLGEPLVAVGGARTPGRVQVSESRGQGLRLRGVLTEVTERSDESLSVSQSCLGQGEDMCPADEDEREQEEHAEGECGRDESGHPYRRHLV